MCLLQRLTLAWDFLKKKSCSDFNINCTCKSDIINHITFAFIILLIVGGISAWVLENKNVFFIFLLLSVLHALFWYSRYIPKVETETFKNVVPPDWIKEEIIGEDVTYPTASNPFMNVLVDEIKYNPTRPPAANGTNSWKKFFVFSPLIYFAKLPAAAIINTKVV